MPHASETGRRIDDYRSRLKIDKFALDDEFVEQPDLLFRVTEQHTLAVSRRDGAKLDMETGIAQRAAYIREQALEAKEKLTEGALQNELNADPKVIQLKEDHLAAVRDAAEWSALVEGFRSRESALKGLTQLYAANYWSMSTGSAPRSAAVESVADRARAAAGEERRNREPLVRHRGKES